MTATRRKRPKKPPRETHEYVTEFVIPCIRRAGVRVAAEDYEGLADLIAIRDAADEAIEAAVVGLKQRDASWSDLARGLGRAKSAVIKQFGHLIATVGTSPPTAQAS